jgi:predicted Fe-Mo cluster-binding NifX family protein
MAIRRIFKMKIAIPSESNNPGAVVCASFGRTPYFTLYDTENKTTVYIENSAAASAGGAGIKAAQIIADSGAEGVITYRCGENAAAVLTAAGIKIYKANGETIQENIDLLIAGKLDLLTEIHSGFHNRGGSV